MSCPFSEAKVNAVVEVSLDRLVRFDVSGWRPRHSDDPSVMVWTPPEGNGVGLYYFPVPPDIPRVETLAELRALECEVLHADGSGLVEHQVIHLGNFLALRSIVKMPTDPTIALTRSGLTYVGSLTIPFARMSFVIKTQAREVGPTGLREAAVLPKELAAGNVIVAGPGQLQGWTPPLPNGGGQLDANLSEWPSRDVEFPNHPLTKVRAILERIQSTAVIDDLLLREAQFPLPRH